MTLRAIGSRAPWLAPLLGLCACQGPCVPSYCDDPSVIVEPTGAEPGPFAIGVIDGTLTSSSVRETFFGSEPVELDVTAWYPSEDADGAEPFCYDGLAPGHGRAGPESACSSPRPVVIYSHGSGGVRWIASYMTEHLATHGYVVAAPSHTHNTFFDNDGSEEGFQHVVLRRPLDVQDTFAWLVGQSADDTSPLFGCVDEAAGYAVVGHSYGGYTALAVGGWDLTPPGGEPASRTDERVWAVMTHAPWDARGTLAPDNDDVDVPLLTLAGELDESTVWEDVAALHTSVDTSPSYLGLLPTAAHNSFVPGACVVLDDGDGCGDAFLGGDEVAGLITRSALLFLEASRGASTVPPTAVESDELIWDPPLP